MPSPTEMLVPHVDGKEGDEEVVPADTGALAVYAFK